MKTYIIYLAAGNSQRFQNNKLLYVLQDKPLYRYTLDQLIGHFDNIIVVTQYLEIADYLSQFPRVTCLMSQECKKGLSFSIKMSLQFLNKVKRPFEMVFVVADQPNLTVSSIERLISESHRKKAKLATLESRKRPGNPTLFHSDYFNELMHLRGDQGGRIVLKYHQDQVLSVFVDDNELDDIDYQNDLTNRQRQY